MQLETLDFEEFKKVFYYVQHGLGREKKKEKQG